MNPQLSLSPFCAIAYFCVSNNARAQHCRISSTNRQKVSYHLIALRKKQALNFYSVERGTRQKVTKTKAFLHGNEGGKETGS